MTTAMVRIHTGAWLINPQCMRRGLQYSVVSVCVCVCVSVTSITEPEAI